MEDAMDDSDRSALGLISALSAEIERQDAKHGPFEGSRLGSSRLALACLEDEVAETLNAWRAERRAETWVKTRGEVVQVAAVAMRALRDAFTEETPADEVGQTNRVGTKPDPRDALDDYERGWLECLHTYAWWKDGTMYVGTSGRTYNHAARSFLLEDRGKPLEIVDRLFPIRVPA
jgi:hypothetical protein